MRPLTSLTIAALVAGLWSVGCRQPAETASQPDPAPAHRTTETHPAPPRRTPATHPASPAPVTAPPASPTAPTPEIAPASRAAKLEQCWQAFCATLDRDVLARDYPGALRDLDSPDPNRQIIALNVLGATEAVEALPWLASLLDSASLHVRVTAGFNLERIITRHELRRRDLNEPSRIVLRPRGPQDRDLRPAAWIVLRMLQSTDANLQAYAATMAGYLGLVDFEPDLRALLKSRHPAVTHSVDFALGLIAPAAEESNDRAAPAPVDR